MYQLKSEYRPGFCYTRSVLRFSKQEEEPHMVGETDTYDLGDKVQLEADGAVKVCVSDCFGLAYERLRRRCRNLGVEPRVVRGFENQSDDGRKICDENEIWRLTKVQTGTAEYQQRCYGFSGRAGYRG